MSRLIPVAIILAIIFIAFGAYRRPSVATEDLLASVTPAPGLAGAERWKLAVPTGAIPDCGMGLSGVGGLWEAFANTERVGLELHLGVCASSIPLWTRFSNWISSPDRAATDRQASRSEGLAVTSLNADTVQAACVNGSQSSCYAWIVLLSYGQYALIVELDGRGYVSESSFLEVVRFVDSAVQSKLQ